LYKDIFPIPFVVSEKCCWQNGKIIEEGILFCHKEYNANPSACALVEIGLKYMFVIAFLLCSLSIKLLIN
jgi:hypothetical protein